MGPHGSSPSVLCQIKAQTQRVCNLGASHRLNLLLWDPICIYEAHSRVRLRELGPTNCTHRSLNMGVRQSRRHWSGHRTQCHAGEQSCTRHTIRFFLPTFRTINREKIANRSTIWVRTKLSPNAFARRYYFSGWPRYIEVVVQPAPHK